jgi:2,3-bisphosphoglycerate-independent phosphoglycerate mutase
MKYILVIGDGMGDGPVAELGGKTVIEAAEIPVIDRLAAQGEQFLVRTVPANYPPGSDVANLSLLGYAPEKYYTGRAPLEAASMGVAIADDELAFRCNLVTVDFAFGRVVMRDYSGGHISSEEAGELIRSIEECCGNEQICFYPGINYRHLMLMKNVPADLETVPPHDYTDKIVTDFYKRYLKVPVLKELLAKVKQVLADHPVNKKRISQGKNPANFIWLWGEGKSPTMEPLSEKFGLRGSLVSAVDLLKGIGVYAGLEVPDIEGATGYIDTNYEGKVEALLAAVSKDNFGVIHLEGPDEAGHRGILADKLQAVEDLNNRVVAPIIAEMERIGEPFRMVVCMDHFTPLSIRTHTDWPVPVLLYDSRGTEKPSGLPYSETNAKKTAAACNLEIPGGEEFFRYFIDGEW